MARRRFQRFESLENRICLTVSASVVDGDLVVTGDADGQVDIVAVGAGAYQVSDNGAIVADGSVLTGVTDDIRINLEDANTDTDDVVTLDLGTEAVDKIYADLGGGNNVFEFAAGTANGLYYHGGAGGDSVSLDGAIESRARVSLGGGDNDLAVGGSVGNLYVRGGDAADLVAITQAATVTGGVIAKLGAGDNAVDLAGQVNGHVLVAGRDGSDAVTVAESATVDQSVRLALGDGDNTATVAGTIGGSLGYDGGADNDQVTLTDTATVADAFFARLGDGENVVTHNGAVDGDFRVVSLNENDTVDIADTALIGGATDLGLGQQTQERGHCHDEGIEREFEGHHPGHHRGRRHGR